MVRSHKSTNSQLTLYHGTIPCSSSGTDPKQIEEELKKIAKRWVFQLEEGESGYKHWQVQLDLKKRVRLQTFINEIRKTILFADENCWSPSHETKFSYAMKPETRINGPWQDDRTTADSTPPIELTGKELYPWQTYVKEDCLQPLTGEDRIINIIFDPIGRKGKSWMAKKFEWDKIASLVPPMRLFEDLISFIMCFDPVTAYIIDIPRAISKKNLEGLWAAVEQVKNGYIWDKRFKGRKRLFSSPHVWVLSNHMPDFNKLTPDRWVMWTISEDKNLLMIPHNP